MTIHAPTPASAAAPEPEIALREHYAASQLRAERWNELKILTERLERAADRGVELGGMVSEVERALRLLRRIEAYWAFPGKRVCGELTRLVDRGWYRILARQTARTVRLLVSDAYRRRDLTQLRADEREDREKPLEQDDSGDAFSAEARPYFEVLVVDDLGPSEEAELRAALLDMRGEDDEFIYDIVVVPSFEDGVTAVMFNHNVQSCVLRYRFPIEARAPIPELSHYQGMVPPELLAHAEDDPAGALAQRSTCCGPSSTCSRSPTTRWAASRRAARAASGA